jgi:hypothetical protein
MARGIRSSRDGRQPGIPGILIFWPSTQLLFAEGRSLVIIRIRCQAGASFWEKLPDCFYGLSLWTTYPC